MPSKHGTLWRVVGVAVLVAFVLGSAGVALAARKTPIRIGEINSYSGLATVYTFPYREGIEMALKEINDAGGVLGRPLEFVFRDDKLRPDEAVKAARELVFQERVDFLAGCISSSVGLALSAWARESRFLYFATHCQSSRLTWDDGHPYIAHTTNNTNQYVRALAKRAATYPYTKWAHISPDYEYGHNLWEEFWDYLKQLKPEVQVLKENWPKLGESDHSSYITALLQSGAEAFFSGLWGSQEIAFVKQAKPFGLFDKLHFFSASVGNPDELDPLGKDAPIGAVTTGFAWYDAGLQTLHPELLDWVKRYMAWSKGKEPKLGATWGYATAYIIAEAIKRAGSTDHAKVIGVLDEGFTMEFPWGTVIMRGCDHQALPPQWTGIVRVNPEGRPVLAEVEETHGKDIVRSCEEVKRLRLAAQKK
ncbi:MAG: twin-arginine translocation pathway signal protein [Candidatus Tectimicrobiota bacterium]|nr:MAG: twin-arginine translocation pathway signal protein [Candidatus Tectomicrobia bacterium]